MVHDDQNIDQFSLQNCEDKEPRQMIAYGNLKQLILRQIREKVNLRCVTAYLHFSHVLNCSLPLKVVSNIRKNQTQYCWHKKT